MNPYKPPMTSSQSVATIPGWYALFLKIYWPAWFGGTVLIAGTWFDLVPPTIGWVGFGIAGTAALGSYVLPSLVKSQPEDVIALDSHTLKSRGAAYADALDRFENGATLLFDGVAFAFRSGGIIACGIVAPTSHVNEVEARGIADHAKSVFDNLAESSPEFATAVIGHSFRISILSSMNADAKELYRVVDGTFESTR